MQRSLVFHPGMRALALAHCALGIGLPVVAQNSAPLALEEVIVTATKREASMQDVSVAVTALTDSAIKEAQITSAEDLTRLVPSLNLQKGTNARQSSFVIRGIGTQSFSSAVEPSVSTMVDGVVMGRSGQAFMQLLDIQRVEVLRGPQGTLFGKNATAGVVHIITKEPTEEHSGELMAGVVEEGEYRGGFSIAGPLSDTLGYRLTATGGSMDDYVDNAFDGGQLNGSNDWTVRGKLRWAATDTLEMKLSSDYGERSCDCTVRTIRSLEPVEGSEAATERALEGLLPVVPGDENQTVNIDKDPFSDWESWGSAMEINWDLSDHVLTSITAYRGFEIDGYTDDDDQPIDALGFDQYGGSEQTQFTQELRITSTFDGPLSYVAGLFYFDQRIERQFQREFEFIPGMPGSALADFAVDTDNWAAFGEATWFFNEDWRLIAGARYTEDELSYEFQRTTEGFPLGLPPSVAPTAGGVDADDLSGKIALQWDFSDRGMTYVSYTQGYKGPALDIIFETRPENLTKIDPETSEAWEVGLKTTLWDNRLQINLALFHATYEEFQAQAFFDPDGVPDCPEDNPNCDPENATGSYQLINAGEVVTQGLEVDFTALLSERLRLSGGLALIDATIEDYPDGPCSGGQTLRGECPNGLQDLSGGDLPFSPEWKVNLAAAYTIPLQTGFDVVLRGMVRSQDDVQFSMTQDENTILDGYTVVDASIALLDQGGRWDATLYVKNVADEFYPLGIASQHQSILPNGYVQTFDKTANRTVGLEMRYRW